MILQRLISALYFAVLIGIILWSIRRKALRGLITSPACPACGYTLQGLTRLQCPECGRPVSAAKIVESAERQALGSDFFAFLFMPAALAFAFWALARALLEINRINKVGPTAFFPGYSLWSDLNSIDLTIVITAVVLYSAATLFVIRITRYHRTRRLTDVSRAARELEDRIGRP